MMGNYFGSGYGFGLNWILMLIFWGLVIWAIVMLIRHFSGSGHSGGGCCSHANHGAHESDTKDNTHVDILKERYAKGEINKEEFEEKKKDLQ